MALSVGVNNNGTQSGGSVSLQGNGGAQLLQPTAAPAYGQRLGGGTRNTALVSSDVSTPASSGSGAAAAAAAAQAAQLRGQIQALVNTVKSIYDTRYGQVNTAAQDQDNQLVDRFHKESQQLIDQVGQQNDQTGAAYAGNGTYDSSYRGNSQDQITKAGDQQIQGLGDELRKNEADIGQWAAGQRASFGAAKAGADNIVKQIASETNPTNLVTLRNQIDNQIASLQAGAANNGTQAQYIKTLSDIAPSTPRTQQLQVTLQSILHGNADPTTKAAIAGSLIAAADIPAADQKNLLQGFHTSLGVAANPSSQQTA